MSERQQAPTAVYLAGRVKRKQELQRYASELATLGAAVTSRWLDSDARTFHANRDPLSWEERMRVAGEDLHDIRRADLVILFTEDPNSEDRPHGNGRLFELGYALGRGKQCLVIGPAENLFVCLPQITLYPDWPTFINNISAVWGARVL